MKTVVIAPRQSLGKLAARAVGASYPIVVTPRAPDSVRGWSHVSRVYVLPAMIEHPKLAELIAIVRPACERFVTIYLVGPATAEQERQLDEAWSTPIL